MFFSTCRQSASLAVLGLSVSCSSSSPVCASRSASSSRTDTSVSSASAASRRSPSRSASRAPYSPATPPSPTSPPCTRQWPPAIGRPRHAAPARVRAPHVGRCLSTGCLRSSASIATSPPPPTAARRHARVARPARRQPAGGGVRGGTLDSVHLLVGDVALGGVVDDDRAMAAQVPERAQRPEEQSVEAVRHPRRLLQL